jgi:Cu2+-exporting ATPase
MQQVEEIPGKGLQAIFEGKKIKLVSKKWCGVKSDAVHAALELWLVIEGNAPVQFTLSDPLREDTAKIILALQQSNIRTILLSSDRHEAVEYMANAVGIEEYHAALSPTEKCDVLEQLKQQGNPVLMVGDELNDAPSLAMADVSISPSTAMDIMQNTADIVFQGNKLSPVFTAWYTAKHANELVKQNFALAVVYNLIAIPMGVMGYVTPRIAALAMSGSSLVVIGNSFRLNFRRQK